MPMAPQELALIRELGFRESLAEFVRSHSRTPIERLKSVVDFRLVDSPGLSLAVANGDEAERLINAIRSRLASEGHRAYWSQRRTPDGLNETDEVAILNTMDPFSIVRLRATDGGNYHISTDDILNRLKAWEQISTFEVVGAASDWVAIQFSRLPDNVCSFAEEVYAFCPDSVGQGVGLARERDDPGRFRAARVLCPEIAVKPHSIDETLQSIERLAPDLGEGFKRLLAQVAHDSTPTDMGIRLLALDMSERKYLFLWWD